MPSRSPTSSSAGAGATTLAELYALAEPAVLVPLMASVSRGDQLDNTQAYAWHATCLVVADEEMTAGPRRPPRRPGTSPPGRWPSPVRAASTPAELPQAQARPSGRATTRGLVASPGHQPVRQTGTHRRCTWSTD
ncbi:glycosyltransferase [Kitasatospora sp. NPDC004531]